MSFSTSQQHCLFEQLKVDEFEANVNEIKDPFPPADFPGKWYIILSPSIMCYEVR